MAQEIIRIEPKYKVGDKLRCIPGFDNQNSDSGGAGYEIGKTFIVGQISNNNGDSTIYWPMERSGMGIYERAVELTESKELPIFN